MKVGCPDLISKLSSWVTNCARHLFFHGKKQKNSLNMIEYNLNAICNYVKTISTKNMVINVTEYSKGKQLVFAYLTSYRILTV